MGTGSSWMRAGVDSVVSTHHNKKLVVTGSADYNTIHYALKHIRKRHHHYMPQKLHNPFRLLFPRHSHSRFTPSWNQSSAGSRHSNNNINQAHSSYDNDPYGPSMALAMAKHRSTTTGQVLSDTSCLILTALLATTTRDTHITRSKSLSDLCSHLEYDWVLTDSV